MNLESSIKDVIATKLGDGTIEKLVSQQLEKGVESALKDLFSYGDLTRVIKDKIKSVMIPYLETYDYSKYIIKLDDVLTEVLKNSALENKNLLENFKELMVIDNLSKEMNVTELFDKWMDYVSENVSTSELEICHEDTPSYYDVEVTFNVEYADDRDWSSYEHAIIRFECEKDDEMNLEINISRWKKDSNKGWDLEYKKDPNIKSLRHLNEFQVFLMKMEQNYTKIIIDQDCDSCEVEVKAEPECTCG